MQREVNGINVITPPDFEPYTGREAYGKGFALDSGSLVVWASRRGTSPHYSEAWLALDLDPTTVARTVSSRSLPTTSSFTLCSGSSFGRSSGWSFSSRSVHFAFPQLKPKDDWTLS